MSRISWTSFVVGAVVATALAAVPAAAVWKSNAAADANPQAYDGTSPLLTLHPTTFRVGRTIDAAGDPGVAGDECHLWNLSVPLQLSWSGGDAASGLAGYDVYEFGPWAEPGGEERVHGTNATRYTFIGGNYDSDCGGGAQDEEFGVVARDNRGNSASSTHASQRILVWQENGYNANHGGIGGGLQLTGRAGSWSLSNCTCFNGGHTLFSTAAGAALTYTFTTSMPGQTVALVMEKNTNRGKANIHFDGGAAASVDTLASSPTHRVIVWQKTVSSPGTHTLKIANAGTSGRSRIDVDSILLH